MSGAGPRRQMREELPVPRAEGANCTAPLGLGAISSSHLLENKDRVKDRPLPQASRILGRGKTRKSLAK